MTEHEPTTKNPEGWPPRTPLEQLPITDTDPVVLERWDEGLREWRDAFVAYTSLGRPELHTPDVLTHFEKTYYTSAESLQALVDDHLHTFGLTEALRRFRQEQSISVDWLKWDYEVVLQQLRMMLDIVEEGGRIHAFSK